MNFQPPSTSRRGFTLIEILVVLAIIGILLVLSFPSMEAVFRGSRLTQAGEQLRSQLLLAQQAAATKNLSVEVHFYKFDDPNSVEAAEYVTAYQIFLLKPNAQKPQDPTAKPEMERIGGLQRLPPGIGLSDNEKISSLLKQDVWRDDPKDEVKGLGKDEMSLGYYALQFRADGSLALPTTEKWFLTLMSLDTIRAKKDDAPPDYICLQLDPDNGQVKWFAPNL